MGADRRARRLAAREAGVQFEPRPNYGVPLDNLHPADLAKLGPEGWRGGDPLLAQQPAASDGTPESIAQAKRESHDVLIEEVWKAGAKRLGPVVWYEWGPADVPDALDYLAQGEPRFEQFRPWFAEHPEGTLVVAAVVTLPGPGVVESGLGPVPVPPPKPGDPCPPCEGTGIDPELPGTEHAGHREYLGCQDCHGTGKVLDLDDEGRVRVPSCRDVGCVGGHPEDEFHRDAHGVTIPDQPPADG